MFSKNFWRRLKRKFKSKDPTTAVVLQRQQHKVSRNNISPNALKVLYRLRKAEFASFLVGGSVRDILLQHQPKDFDIATEAKPEQIRKIFRNSRIIGRRFRLVHVLFRDEIIEVSTFRANAQEPTKPAATEEDNEIELPEMIRSDNIYGTMEEDAWRRDFTVNALYYNIEDFSVVDYTGGMLDIQRRQIRMIGDPVQRYHEDPVRLLRAIRLASKLNFKIEEGTEEPLSDLVHLLQHVPPSRLLDEMIKLFFKGHAVVTYKRLCKYGYFDALFPQTAQALKDNKLRKYMRLIKLVMQATDLRMNQGLSLNPGFLFSVILWPALQAELVQQKGKHAKFYQEVHSAIELVITKQVETVMIPRRLSSMIRAIWLLQYHLISRRGKRVWRTFRHRYFRAAYDLLDLRAQAGEPYKEVVDWWTQFQKADNNRQTEMVEKLREERYGSQKQKKSADARQ